MRLVEIDQCAVPRRLARPLRKLKRKTGCEFASVYRGEDAKRILNRYGKHTQAQLVGASSAQRAAWGVMGTPNPTHESTHELYSDGRAYPHIPARHKLPDQWMCGFDIFETARADTDDVIREARRLGWVIFRPYGDGVERHHLNFRRKPRWWHRFTKRRKR